MMSGIEGNGRSAVVSTGIAEEPRCPAVNPLEKAMCQLRAGHEGPHWGHGPTWQWDDTMCQTVPPPEEPPVAV